MQKCIESDLFIIILFGIHTEVASLSSYKERKNCTDTKMIIQAHLLQIYIMSVVHLVITNVLMLVKYFFCCFLNIYLSQKIRRLKMSSLCICCTVKRNAGRTRKTIKFLNSGVDMCNWMLEQVCDLLNKAVRRVISSLSGCYIFNEVNENC